MATAAPKDMPATCARSIPIAPRKADLIGMAVGRVRRGRLVAVAGAGKVYRDAAEVLGLGRKLERVAGVVRGRVRDQQGRLALPLHVVLIVSPSTSTCGMLDPS
jgi:hypothetical protein